MTNPQTSLNADDLHKLLDNVSKTIYKPKDMDPQAEAVMSQCLELIKKDYKISVISNAQGELCSHYPSQIPLMEYSLTDPANTNEGFQSLYDMSQLRDLITKARFARCRSRFVVPVILYEGKSICRSGTISGGVEIYGRSGFDFFFSGGESIPAEEAVVDTSTNTEWQLFDRLRGQDIRLLKELSVSHIVDLMMEKKKVKFGMNVTSSEKVDKQNRYGEFTIYALPYPGCEFFREWKDNSYNGEGLGFDWSQAYVDANLDIPHDRIASQMNMNWKDYKSWDLIKITGNYLKLLLEFIKEGDKSVLVHCISGWDRTPLFVSLLRLSLWADGAAHSSLTAIEILYLTIAYDWFLFGHNLPDRLMKGEEIFFFCFTFLKYIASEEYSVYRKRPRSISTTDSDTNLGVLLETDPVHSNDSGLHSNGTIHRGSTTSLSSNGSVGSQLNDSFTLCSNKDSDSAGGSTSSHSRKSPCSRLSSSSDSSRHVPSHVVAGVHSHVTSSHVAGNHVAGAHVAGSSPMAVPVRHLAEQARSPCSSSAGSWQIISGTGSLRGTASSSCDSEHRSSISSAHSCCMYHETAGDHHDEFSSRRQKLETARRIFTSMYTASIGLGANGENGGISGLLDHFAEKVGFRSRGTTIP